MSNQKEICHQIFYDTSVYTRITAKNNQKLADQFYRSVQQNIPTLINGIYKVCFPWVSLLEVIGLGNFQERNPRLDLTEFCIEAADMHPEEKLSGAFDKACNHFLNHPSLAIPFLLTKIEEQLERSLKDDLVNDTLIRYKKFIIENPSEAKDSLAKDLAWDAICGFSFLNFEQTSIKNQKVLMPQLIQIREWLLQFFYNKKIYEGVDLNSYRLTDKIQKELLSTQEFLEETLQEYEAKNYLIRILDLLEPHKDLCDAELIHFATFSNEDTPGILFTSDARRAIEKRLILQLSVMRFLRSAESSKLKLLLGTIYFVDPNTCCIYDKIEVAEIKDDARINIILQALEGNNKPSVSFKKPPKHVLDKSELEKRTLLPQS